MLAIISSPPLFGHFQRVPGWQKTDSAKPFRWAVEDGKYIMEEYRETIIRKYRHIARLPDFLFGFTFPLRRKAIERLHLQPGSSVLEIGCSSGANFALLHEAVGETGEIVGVDLSPDMIAQAKLRIEKTGWKNIAVIEKAAEEVVLERQFDGLLLFAMHDVLTAPKALDNVLKYLKSGGYIVTAGPMLPSKYPGKLLRPLIKVIFSRFAVSKEYMDTPWRMLAERVKELRVTGNGPGIFYIADGKRE